MLPKITKDIIIDDLLYLISIGEIDRKSIEVIIKDLRKVSNNSSAEREYATFELGLTAYLKILDDGGTAIEALEYACFNLGKPEGYADTIKHNNYLHAKKVVDSEEVRRHYKHKDIVRNKVINIKELKKAKTVHQQLNSLVKAKTLSDNIDNLTKSVENHKHKIEVLEAEVGSHKDSIKALEKSTGIPVKSDKDKAIWLYTEGHTISAISSVLSVHRVTVSRWIRDNKLNIKET